MFVTMSCAKVVAHGDRYHFVVVVLTTEMALIANLKVVPGV